MIDMIQLGAIFDASVFFNWFIEHANYIFVFLFMAIESSFIPFPSELVVPPAAYLAVSGIGAGAGMNIWLVIAFASLGAMCGAYINYFLALWIGRPVVYKFANSRIGHACLLDESKVRKAEDYFDRHGAVSTFLGRLIPAVRQLISIPAGLARMNLGTFTIFTFMAVLLWNSILALLGYWLAKTVSPALLFEKVETYNDYLSAGGWVLAAVCVLYILWNAFKPRDNKQ